MKRYLPWIAVMSFFAIILPGCTDGVDRPSGWTRVTEEEELTEKQQAGLNRAREARKQLGQTLLSRVMEVINEEGHAEAIRVCRDEAESITDRIAGEQGVRIGRTSHRLRNPENTPPGWASHLPEKQPKKPEVFIGPNGEVGHTHPIRTAPPCTSCHGPEDQLDEEVKQRLSQAYPEDEATGFEAGEIRGWFWVEVNGK